MLARAYQLDPDGTATPLFGVTAVDHAEILFTEYTPPAPAEGVRAVSGYAAVIRFDPNPCEDQPVNPFGWLIRGLFNWVIPVCGPVVVSTDSMDALTPALCAALAGGPVALAEYLQVRPMDFTVMAEAASVFGPDRGLFVAAVADVLGYSS